VDAEHLDGSGFEPPVHRAVEQPEALHGAFDRVLALDPGRAQERGLEPRVVRDEGALADEPRRQGELQGLPGEYKAPRAAVVELQQFDLGQVRVAPRLLITARCFRLKAISPRKRAILVDLYRLTGFGEFGLERGLNIETQNRAGELLGRRYRLIAGLDQDGLDSERIGEGYRLPVDRCSTAPVPEKAGGLQPVEIRLNLRIETFDIPADEDVGTA
jgi:hypothetical protein